MLAAQDVRFDVANRVETYVTTHLGGFWDLVERVPAVHRRVNGVLIDRVAHLLHVDLGDHVEAGHRCNSWSRGRKIALLD